MGIFLSLSAATLLHSHPSVTGREGWLIATTDDLETDHIEGDDHPLRKKKEDESCQQYLSKNWPHQENILIIIRLSNKYGMSPATSYSLIHCRSSG
jgi:hypothetical protein